MIDLTCMACSMFLGIKPISMSWDTTGCKGGGSTAFGFVLVTSFLLEDGDAAVAELAPATDDFLLITGILETGSSSEKAPECIGLWTSEARY